MPHWCTYIKSDYLSLKILLKHHDQYETLVDRNASSKYAPPNFICVIHYGILEMILEIILPENHLLQIQKPHHLLLTIVSNCNTNGKDAAKERTSFTTQGLSAAVDLAAICAVVGYFKYSSVEEKWAIVDQSTDYT